MTRPPSTPRRLAAAAAAVVVPVLAGCGGSPGPAQTVTATSTTTVTATVTAPMSATAVSSTPAAPATPPPTTSATVQAWYTGDVKRRFDAVNTAISEYHQRTYVTDIERTDELKSAVDAARADLPTPDDELTRDLTESYKQWVTAWKLNLTSRLDELLEAQRAGDAAQTKANARLRTLLG